MFIYCGNNPAARVDRSGQLWGLVAGIVAVVVAVAGTVNDIYQLTRQDESEKVTTVTTANSVQIRNSYKIVTPWVRYSYSLYLNHSSEYSDYLVGTGAGSSYEWGFHNWGYVGCGAMALLYDCTGHDATAWEKLRDSCKHVDLGPTIYDDATVGNESTTRKALGMVMKVGYSLTASPISVLHDVIACMIN